MSGAVIVVGAGPGIGAAVAHRFARENHPVALLARRRDPLEAIRRSLPAGVRVATVAADCGDERSLRRGLDAAVVEVGPPEVVVYNAALIRPDTVRGTTMDAALGAWAVNVGGAVVTAAHLLPAMAERGSGSYLVTGGMPEPKPDYLTLSLGKAGVRTLVTVLDAEFGAQGVHVASVTVGGVVAPGTPYDPDVVAERYWSLHHQPVGAWESEVLV